MSLSKSATSLISSSKIEGPSKLKFEDPFTFEFKWTKSVLSQSRTFYFGFYEHQFISSRNESHSDIN